MIEAKWGISSTFGIWASILGIEGSWTSKFKGPQCPLCPQSPLHSAHSGPSNFEVQLPLMPKIKSQIPKVELNQSPNQIAQIVLFHFDIKSLGILWILWIFVSKIFLAMTMAMSIYRTLCVLVFSPFLSFSLWYLWFCLSSLGFLLSERTSGISPVIFNPVLAQVFGLSNLFSEP